MGVCDICVPLRDTCWIAKGVRLSQILERNAHTAEGSQKLWDYAFTNFIEPNVKTGKIKDDTK